MGSGFRVLWFCFKVRFLWCQHKEGFRGLGVCGSWFGARGSALGSVVCHLSSVRKGTGLTRRGGSCAKHDVMHDALASALVEAYTVLRTP